MYRKMTFRKRIAMFRPLSRNHDLPRRKMMAANLTKRNQKEDALLRCQKSLHRLAKLSQLLPEQEDHLD
jgi:hypothetical protein